VSTVAQHLQSTCSAQGWQLGVIPVNASVCQKIKKKKKRRDRKERKGGKGRKKGEKEGGN
jgi:hypothetical protein